MPTIQNFSVPRGNSLDVTVNVETDVVGETLEGAEVFWSVWEQKHGVVTTDATGARLPPLIQKTVGHGITVLASPPMEFVISMEQPDTVGLLGNFYHEAEVIDGDGNHVTVMQGLLTVTEAELSQ